MHRLFSIFAILTFSSNLIATPLPDLTDLPLGLDLAPKQRKTIKISKSELEKQALSSLKRQLENMSSLSSSQQLRLISLVEEMQGKPDQAYLSLKKIADKDEKLWYAFRELYLSDILGLEEDTHKLAHLINERLQLKRLKINKVLFCKSVKGFGIYDAYPGSLSLNQTAIIYVEIHHLEQQVQSGTYRSSCRASFDIRDQHGLSVYHLNYPNPFAYEAQSPLQDYFIWVKWTPSLPPGKYKMHLNIEDEQSGITDVFVHSFELK
jgi:hypothetical protein